MPTFLPAIHDWTIEEVREAGGKGENEASWGVCRSKRCHNYFDGEKRESRKGRGALPTQPVKWEMIAIVPCLEKNSHYSEASFELVEMTEAACTAGGALGGTRKGSGLLELIMASWRRCHRSAQVTGKQRPKIHDFRIRLSLRKEAKLNMYLMGKRIKAI